MIRPEKMVDRLIVMPSAATIAAANKPVDSGRAASITNNLGHLIEQDAGQLFWDVGETYSTLSSNDLATFSGDIPRDGTPPSAAGVTRTANKIGWSAKTARRYGPFAIIADEGDSAVNAKPRKVRIVARFDAVGSIYLSEMCAAITAGSSPEEILTGRELAYAQGSVTAIETEKRFDLEPDVTVDVTYPTQRGIPSAPTGTGAAVTQVRTFYVWLGWAMYKTGTGSFTLQSVSAFEYR